MSIMIQSRISQFQARIIIFKKDSMQTQSYARTLLYEISARINRRKEDMQPFIRTLESEWRESQEALTGMKAQDFERLKIPGGLANMIMQAVKPKETKMDIESPVEDFLFSLGKKCPETVFNQKVETLGKIFTNIRQNLIEEKYRTLKKSNQKILDLVQSKQVVQVLTYGGFEENSQSFVLKKVNISLIDECLDAIAKYKPKIQFNPYQSHISSIGDTNVASYEGDSSVQYNQKLAGLEEERKTIMSKPIKNRDARVYQIQPNYQSQFEQQFNEQKEYNNQDEKLYMENAKKQLKKQMEDPKFMNRRMQQYFDLLKKPCFSETLIRVKLHDNWIFQCKFSPLETLQTLVKVFHEYVAYPELSYYLYMTPPVQKLSGIILRKTFDDLGCVPRAIFYFKTQEILQGNIFKLKKSNFLGY